MKSRVHCLLSVLSVVALFAISYATLGQQTPQTQQPPSTGTTGAVYWPHGVTGRPYSAEEITESTQTLADGTHITHKSLIRIFRDSEGRIRREMFRQPTNGEQEDTTPASISIFDPVTGSDYWLDPRNHTARKTDLPRPMPAPAANVKANPRPASTDRPQLTREDLGTQVIEGFEVRGTRITVTIPVGAQGNDQPMQMTSERWFSPELGLMLMYSSNDPRNGQRVQRVTNVVREEPPAELFQVPPDYTIEEMQKVVQPAPQPE